MITGFTLKLLPTQTHVRDRNRRTSEHNPLYRAAIKPVRLDSYVAADSHTIRPILELNLFTIRSAADPQYYVRNPQAITAQRAE